MISLELLCFLFFLVILALILIIVYLIWFNSKSDQKSSPDTPSKVESPSYVIDIESDSNVESESDSEEVLETERETFVPKKLPEDLAREYRKKKYPNGNYPKFKDTIPEIICKQYLESVYGGKCETNYRPSWLKNPETGGIMELDVYHPKQRIAIEYNGPTHDTWPNHTNQTKEEFIQQLRRDRLKIKLCDLNDVYLITIPSNISYNFIPNFIDYYLPENVQKRKENEEIYGRKILVTEG